MSSKLYQDEFNRLAEDADFSAQAYFEAAKSASFWGRSIVFLPALLGACGALLVALGEGREWGVLGAIASVVAATSSFLGSTQRAISYLDCARKFTQVRHSARLEFSLSSISNDPASLEATLRALRAEYGEIVSTSDPVPNRVFHRAAKRIHSGVLEYRDARTIESQHVSGRNEKESQPE